MAANNRNKLDEYHLKILRELLTHPANKYCFDCHQRGPTYVNVTIGSFVCSSCSGMLRGLTPPHRVKSITVATFTPEEIEIMKSRGNQYCKTVWLALHDDEVPASDEQQIKDFMIAKYEKKRYYADPSMAATHCVISFGSGSRTPSSLSSTSSSSHNSPSSLHLSDSATKIQDTCTIRPQQLRTSCVTSNGNSQLLASKIESPVAANTTTMPLVDPFSSPVDSSSSSEISFANFDNNPAFGGSKLIASSGIATENTLNFCGGGAGKAQINVPPEDKYAALKDLDFQMKNELMEKQQEELKQKLGPNTNGVNWNSLFSNQQCVSSEPSTPFNPFANEVSAWKPTLNGSNGSVNPFNNNNNNNNNNHNNNNIKADPWGTVIGDTNGWNSSMNGCNGSINPPIANGKDTWNGNLIWQNSTNVFTTTNKSNGWTIDETPFKLQVGAWPQTNGQHQSSNPFL